MPAETSLLCEALPPLQVGSLSVYFSLDSTAKTLTIYS